MPPITTNPVRDYMHGTFAAVSIGLIIALTSYAYINAQTATTTPAIQTPTIDPTTMTAFYGSPAMRALIASTSLSGADAVKVSLQRQDTQTIINHLITIERILTDIERKIK